MQHSLSIWRATGLGTDELKLFPFPNEGRGVMTLIPRRKGEVIFAIPERVFLSAEKARGDLYLGELLKNAHTSFTDDEVLAIYILYIKIHYQKPRFSMYEDYLKQLPTQYTSSVFFNERELDICEGSSLYTITNVLKQQIRDDYTKTNNNLFERFPDAFPSGVCTFENYSWAICTVWSRAMDFKLSDGSVSRIIAPFADMLNHSPDVEICHIYDEKAEVLQVIAGKDYKKGDQVFINYGTVSNNRLSRLYGFVLNPNPHDSYDLVMTMARGFDDDSLYDVKVAFLASAGFEETTTIPLTLRDPLPQKVLQYLRIRHLTMEELTFDTKTRVSSR